MERIAIIGCSGGGKSTLARRLGAKLDLPVVHLDQLFWLRNWVEEDPSRFRAKLETALAGGRWVCDGNYMKLADLHLARAELIVWVDQPRGLCIRRALARAITGYGRTRADMAPGCNERFDLEFMRYIWDWNRIQTPKVERSIARHAPTTPVVRLTSDREISEWLARV